MKGICKYEAKVRAFLRTLKKKEGEPGEIGYETNCGGKSFITYYKKTWKDHPNVSVYIPRLNKKSDAAGAYQAKKIYFHCFSFLCNSLNSSDFIICNV